MSWTCDQIEARLSEYLDGLLAGAERESYAAHVAGCPQCGPLVSSVHSLIGEMKGMEELSVPPQLMRAILDKTFGPPPSVWQEFLNWLRAIASPRLAYGAASIVATFIILGSASGFSLRKPKMADLHPANVYHNADRQVHLVYARSVKYVSDLRVVYEIQSRLRQDQNDLQSSPDESLPKAVPEKGPGQTDDHKPAQPKQQNRANELARRVEMLAAECPILFERSFR
jgi:Putative zinc-finger